MRLLHVIAGAEVGGAETFALDAIEGLAGREIEQFVICRPWPRAIARYAAAGIGVAPMRFGWRDHALGGGRRIRAVARWFGADLAHAWMARAASFMPAEMPCPVVGWFGDTYDLRYFRRCDVFLGVTPAIVAHIAGHGIPPERVLLTNTFGTMPESAPVDRAALGVPEGAPLLLVLARMHPVKGIDIFLRAVAATPGLFAWIAGDGPERAAYEALAVRLGLGDRVRFLGWRDDRKALLAACDVVVLPSRYEPFGTVILEAWAMRRPLVATRADGARQYVTDGETGLLCEIDDAAGLAEQLRRVTSDAALRARLADAGHRRYEAEFTREIVLGRLLEAYASARVLGKRGSG
jgi:glycosyltransferase involved in cell wall biosynthesis